MNSRVIESASASCHWCKAKPTPPLLRVRSSLIPVVSSEKSLGKFCSTLVVWKEWDLLGTGAGVTAPLSLCGDIPWDATMARLGLEREKAFRKLFGKCLFLEWKSNSFIYFDNFCSFHPMVVP